MADLSHMGVDTRMYIKKQVQTDRLVSILMRKEEEEEEKKRNYPISDYSIVVCRSVRFFIIELF